MTLRAFAAVVSVTSGSLAPCGICGCVPAVATTAPALSGRVVDSAGRPVARATVEITKKPASLNRTNFGTRTFTADDQGRIERPEERHWVLHMIPGDVYGADLQVNARANGAESIPHDVSVAPGVRIFGIGSPQHVDVGELRVP
jgi:hypothetical protein